MMEFNFNPLKSAFEKCVSPCVHSRVLTCVLPVAVAVCWCRWGPGRTTPPARLRTETSRGRTESACCSWRLPGRWTSPCCPAHLEKNTRRCTVTWLMIQNCQNRSSFLSADLLTDDWIKTREEHFTASLLNCRCLSLFSPPSLTHSTTYSLMHSAGAVHVASHPHLCFSQGAASVLFLHNFQMPPHGVTFPESSPTF